jgi:hypothetical protein
MKTLTRLAFVGLLLAPSSVLFAQSTVGGQQVNSGNIPLPAMSFLNFAPDARSAGMADVGVATTPDAYSIFWNPAKTVFNESTYGAGMTYNPWLRNLIDDMSLINLTGFYKFKKNQSLGLMVNYFNQGAFDNTSSTGQILGRFYSNEFAVNLSYSRKMTDNMGVGVTLKYVNSNLFGNAVVNGVTVKPATSVAADLGIYWRNPRVGRKWSYAYGISISNIGGKLSYGGVEENFLPTNFRIGASATSKLDDHNTLSFSVDLNKLMVPTPDARGDWKKKGVFEGMFGSFGDAPGGFSEELKEFTTSIGAEYTYNKMFSVRTGYFFESQMKGNRKYVTAGLGIKVDKFAFDFAYLIPTTEQSPLANTLRLGISALLDPKPKAKTDDKDEKLN